MSPMNPPSTRIRKRPAPQRPLPDPQQTPSVLQRRSTRIQSRTRHVSVTYIPGSYHASQSPREQRPTAAQTSQPLGETSYTAVEASARAPSSAHAQEHLSSPEKQIYQTRKRGLDTSFETSGERPLKCARLTRRNLKELENMGGQRRQSAGKGSTGRSSSTTTTTNKDLGLHRHQPKSKSSYSGTKSTQSKQSTSTTDSGFPDIAFQNGILNPNCSKPPANLESRQDRIDRSRETASPSESDYQYFASAIRRAPNEASVLYETSMLLQRYNESGYHKSYNQAFNNFPKNIGFNDDLSAAQPDMVEGLDLTQFDPFPAREQLGGAATVYSGPEATTLPHLAGEWKGPGKDMILAQTQAAYDGACMVYGRNEARSYLESPDPPGYAFVSTFTTDGTTVNTFAHYSSETQGQVKYHQYPESSSLLISSYQDFKKSRRRLRNLQDDAKETSEKLRDELNEKWLANHRSSVGLSIPAETANATDCDSHDYDDDEDPNNQLLAEYWTSFPTNNEPDSSAQVPAVDSVYAPPYANLPANDEDDHFIQSSHTNNRYISPDGPTFPPITPPQSTKDASLPLEPSGDVEQAKGRGNKRTRRTRRQAIIVDSRKPRRKHEG
ncbi:hypothetical protein ONS95_012798 [Cadophora gregata]|uniref:uncharacterized protein n=1 Tax=Cadophora gregata TaxID=51156 RepID=UPI0026DB3DA4|nr:uncharacterized protein ONS95_012798 [Cadophora gregata]KAK0101219.1 hypothetical protein ONS96_006441 [Cadophora gregata f. sp. sojae]KAK0115745.1 hypothetical protein ONS95_012798 [Cadophora gregata]